MIDLTKQSGLPLAWDKNELKLACGEAVRPRPCEPAVRKKSDMAHVLYDHDPAEPQDLYYMYRGLYLDGDEERITAAGLRYDLTIIRPGLVGKEYVKTAGHYHPPKGAKGQTWPEVYEVIHGRAHYLLQKPHPAGANTLEEVFLIAARPGDKVLIPPGFGHVTINPGEEFLVMSNWVARGFSSIYEPYRQMEGAAYFELCDTRGPRFVPNTNYSLLPPLKRCPVIPVEELSLYTSRPFYTLFCEEEDVFDYLVHPERYGGVFERYIEQLSCS